MLVDGRGVPLSIIVTGANRHDVSQIAAVLDAIVVVRPTPLQGQGWPPGYFELFGSIDDETFTVHAQPPVPPPLELE